MPELPAIARSNRQFVGRVIRFLAGEAGIRQFLDIGTGLPTQDNVHTVAERIAPGARVIYVDNDPVVCCHGHALLASGDRVAMVAADLRKPTEILDHPRVRNMIDFDEPLGLICASVLHFIPDEAEPYQIIAQLRDAMAPGSYLAISHGTMEDIERVDDAAMAVNVYSRASAQLALRSLDGVGRFFDGFDLVEPGLTWITQWRPHSASAAEPAQPLRGAVGRKAT
jgi:SAM-dependent methyltransferase